jgi:hypothetical protein
MGAGIKSTSKPIPWTKAKKALIWGIAGLLVLVAATLYFQRHAIANRMMVARGEHAVASHIATPVDLTASYATQDQGWDIPWDFQVFNDVPLQIDGSMYLWGAGNSKAGVDFAEEITGIPVNRKFDTLYVYHATFYSAPKGTPVYELVFRYEDGSSVTNQLLYDSDLLDFNSGVKGNRPVKGPTGHNSRLAWVGGSFTPDGKQPLRFCLTAIKNPQAGIEVTSIDLYSSKGRAAAVILAMTTGPSDLMK